MDVKDFNLEWWWKSEGCKELNAVLVNLIGNNIGFVPLENLGINELALSEKNIEKFVKILTNDGYTLRKLFYEGELVKYQLNII